MRVKHYPEYGAEQRYGFICPGCKSSHILPTAGPRAWVFNGNVDKPTFTPSILSWTEAFEDIPKMVCHSFVTDGKIQFLGDCTHELKNQTVDLPFVKP